MRGFNFNFITVLAFTLLIIYAYMAAMGFLYQSTDPDITMAGLCFVAAIAVVSVCIYIMCRAKASRWVKVGTPVQTVLGMVIVATFVFFGQYFSSYVSMLTQEDSVKEKIDENVNAAKRVNDAYNDYANKRIEDYQPQESTPKRQQLRKRALERQLLPLDLSAKQLKRNEWLDSMRNSKLQISNIQTPSNLNIIEHLVDSCVVDYKNLSDIVFIDEQDVAAFDFKYQSVNLREGIKNWIVYLSYFIAIICSVFMLIPYFTTDTDFSLKDGKRDGIGAKLSGWFGGNRINEKQDEPDYL